MVALSSPLARDQRFALQKAIGALAKQLRYQGRGNGEWPRAPPNSAARHLTISDLVNKRYVNSEEFRALEERLVAMHQEKLTVIRPPMRGNSRGARIATFGASPAPAPGTAATPDDLNF